MSFPKVTKRDNGIRPAGKPDECFYCNSKVGEEHGKQCVIVSKRVKLKMTISFDVEVPHGWTQEDIEFHRNESSWCVSNVIHDLERFKKNGHCLCPDTKIEYVETVDETPMIVKDRKLRMMEGEDGQG